jgi:hypothetical protein
MKEVKKRGRKANPNKPVKVKTGKRGRPSLPPELRKQKPVKTGKRGRSQSNIIETIENDPTFNSRFEQFKIQSKTMFR